MYADDTKIYGEVDYHNDIQTDLDRIFSWSVKWMLPLNTSKCIVLHLGLWYHNALGVKIENLDVPERVNYGDDVTLDCVYKLDEHDHDVVVKWFLNDGMVYQWIVNHKPIALGVLKDSLELNYESTVDQINMYRALRIKDFKPKFAGNYTCMVSTLESEDIQSKKISVIGLWDHNALGVKIENLDVPERVNYGDDVTLDCVYKLDEHDHDVVVKWFLNDGMVYQWIVNHKPIALGVLKDSLDLNYESTVDQINMYRALRIKDFKPKFAGNYTCMVSTLESEDIQSKKISVIAVPDSLQFQHTHLENDKFEIQCRAQNVYPRPTMKLYIKESVINNTSYELWKTSPKVNIKATANVTIEEKCVDVTCKLFIPETEITLTKQDTICQSGN